MSRSISVITYGGTVSAQIVGRINVVPVEGSGSSAVGKRRDSYVTCGSGLEGVNGLQSTSTRSGDGRNDCQYDRKKGNHEHVEEVA